MYEPYEVFWHTLLKAGTYSYALCTHPISKIYHCVGLTKNNLANELNLFKELNRDYLSIDNWENILFIVRNCRNVKLALRYDFLI